MLPRASAIARASDDAWRCTSSPVAVVEQCCGCISVSAGYCTHRWCGVSPKNDKKRRELRGPASPTRWFWSRRASEVRSGCTARRAICQKRQPTSDMAGKVAAEIKIARQARRSSNSELPYSETLHFAIIQIRRSLPEKHQFLKNGPISGSHRTCATYKTNRQGVSTPP